MFETQKFVIGDKVAVLTGMKTSPYFRDLDSQIRSLSPLCDLVAHACVTELR